MVDQTETLKQPQIAEQSTDSKLGKLDAGTPQASDTAVEPKKVRNFEKEVHTWNPTLPMWRRSPKE
ncbi:MAG: hypothetical protein WCF68_11635 [Terriglobales bacterium]